MAAPAQPCVSVPAGEDEGGWASVFRVAGVVGVDLYVATRGVRVYMCVFSV